MASFGSLKSAIFERVERKQQYQAHIRGLNDRHKKFLNDYVEFYRKERKAGDVLPVKTDQGTLRECYRFIRSEEDDMDSSWEQRLVKCYYDKLFKEYCIADMSQYKKGKIGLRWRVEKEVISGKGQFICGNKRCNEKDGLASYEVNFSYHEAGENKQALVKLVCCEGSDGGALLTYTRYLPWSLRSSGTPRLKPASGQKETVICKNQMPMFQISTKISIQKAESRKQKAKSRKQKAESRKQKAESRKKMSVQEKNSKRGGRGKEKLLKATVTRMKNMAEETKGEKLTSTTKKPASAIKSSTLLPIEDYLFDLSGRDECGSDRPSCSSRKQHAFSPKATPMDFVSILNLR